VFAAFGKAVSFPDGTYAGWYGCASTCATTEANVLPPAEAVVVEEPATTKTTSAAARARIRGIMGSPPVSDRWFRFLPGRVLLQTLLDSREVRA
jgi:hypothetical protein